MTTAGSDLHQQLAERDAQIVVYEAELKSRDVLIEKLKHQLAGMRQHRFGAKSEAIDQLGLALEEEEIAAAAEAPEPSAAAEMPKGKPKRKPLPATLPRNDTVLSPGETCACGGKLRAIAEGEP